MIHTMLLLAQSASGSVDKSLSISWAIVLFFVILGALVTLSPSRRTTEIKRHKEG
ncbi:MAG: hypothetical protein IT425_00390 [Pirellulales bacterium]|nr:hypothetical protein [Pirellulales bacterium]